MFKKTFLVIALQVVVLGFFTLIALGSGSSSRSLTYDEACEAGYKIGEGLGTLINN